MPQIFNISYVPQFKLFFEKKNLVPKVSKLTQKFTQNRQTVVMVVSIEISSLALTLFRLGFFGQSVTGGGLLGPPSVSLEPIMLGS